MRVILHTKNGELSIILGGNVPSIKDVLTCPVLRTDESNNAFERWEELCDQELEQGSPHDYELIILKRLLQENPGYTLRFGDVFLGLERDASPTSDADASMKQRFVVAEAAWCRVVQMIQPNSVQ